MNTLNHKKAEGGKRKKIAFAFLMGLITTFIISFTIVSINIGFNELFLTIWIRSWMTAYALVIPTILFVAPAVQKVIDRLFETSNTSI
ncbi:DUF2798 domain-containing protein [Flammeovirga sp. SJP92]|uniref:DUF2798 domain-containing protein n=1 Tax=Flammeovirga sp. SJP92 TaxID=1775430 RepID=UPI000788CED0|nr:DUF2798 domain-containing protein [Flammeovirga sp. SJP92]KXX70859.1 hypothetical protein AVL50_11425 [Flammeovirga sp. SJP92]